MTRHRLAPLWAFALFAFSPADAQPAPPPPTPDALVEQLIHAFPDAAELENPTIPPPDAAEVTRLNGLNPGREAEVLTILRDRQSCNRPVVIAGTRRALRQIIRDLGEPTARRLLQYFTGPDLAVIARFQERRQRGEILSPADLARFRRIVAAYPLDAFIDRFAYLRPLAMQDPVFLADMDSCTRAALEAMSRLGLRDH